MVPSDISCHMFAGFMSDTAPSGQQEVIHISREPRETDAVFILAALPTPISKQSLKMLPK